MKNVMCKTIFCVSFVSAAFAAESPEQSPFVTRGVGLGDTGTARPQRANSLKRAPTIRVTLPRKTSNEEGKRMIRKSPRSETWEFDCTRNTPVVLPTEPFDFSKTPEPKTIPSYGYAEKK